MKPLVTHLHGEPPSLETVQELVGGYVELVPLPFGNQLLVNEEGLLQSLPDNPVASQLAGKRIVGNAVLLTDKAKWKSDE